MNNLRRPPKTPPRAFWRRERAPKKLGGSGWEVKIAPQSPRRAPKRAPRAPWKPPRAPARTPKAGKRAPREHPNALNTTENIPRATEAIREGSLKGQGMGEGILKESVPEAHTDYVIAVISEEFGSIVSILIISILKRILIIIQHLALNIILLVRNF